MKLEVPVVNNDYKIKESEEEVFKLVERLDIRGPRYTSYPTVPVWKQDFSAKHHVSSLETLAQRGDSVALYMHFPFCNKKCLFCGCNSYVTHDQQRIDDYINGLKNEITITSDILNGAVRHKWLHLGGGTPTHIPVSKLIEVLQFLIERIPGAELTERSLEVDPRVTTDEHLHQLSELGFRRVSIGLQDLNPSVQKAVRRQYSFEQMNEFVQKCRDAGFTSINIDLIYGLPLQTRSSWLATLQKITHFKPDRLACFGYAHLPQRMVHQQAIIDNDLPGARDRLGMLLDANLFFTDLGYDAIGFDHFALPNDELSIAMHNGELWRNFMGYTEIRGLEMIGLGASSISEFENVFTQNVTPPQDYNDIVKNRNWAVVRGFELDDDDRIRKQLINDLMCNLEIRIPKSAYELGGETLTALENAMTTLKPFEKEGLIQPYQDGQGYHITTLGRLFVRNLAIPFDRYLPEQTQVKFSRVI